MYGRHWRKSSQACEVSLIGVLSFRHFDLQAGFASQNQQLLKGGGSYRDISLVCIRTSHSA